MRSGGQSIIVVSAVVGTCVLPAAASIGLAGVAVGGGNNGAQTAVNLWDPNTSFQGGTPVPPNMTWQTSNALTHSYEVTPAMFPAAGFNGFSAQHTITFERYAEGIRVAGSGSMTFDLAPEFDLVSINAFTRFNPRVVVNPNPSQVGTMDLRTRFTSRISGPVAGTAEHQTSLAASNLALLSYRGSTLTDIAPFVAGALAIPGDPDGITPPAIDVGAVRSFDQVFTYATGPNRNTDFHIFAGYDLAGAAALAADLNGTWTYDYELIVGVIPAPGSGALLGTAGLVALRRRR